MVEKKQRQEIKKIKNGSGFRAVCQTIEKSRKKAKNRLTSDDCRGIINKLSREGRQNGPPGCELSAEKNLKKIQKSA